MLKTTLSVIQQAAFGTTFSASVGGLPVVRWLPTGRDACKNPHSSTGLTRIACRIDGRESIRFALRRCKRGETSFNYIRSGLGKFCNRRGLSLERALDAEIQLANHDHIRHGPVVGGDPARAGYCLREQAQARTSTAFRILWIQSIYGSDFCADLDLLNAVGAYPDRDAEAYANQIDRSSREIMVRSAGGSAKVSYAGYYNSIRTHRSLNKHAPISRPVQRNRCDLFTRHPGPTPSPLRPFLSCRYTGLFPTMRITAKN